MVEPIPVAIEAALDVFIVDIYIVSRCKLRCALPRGNFLPEKPGVALVLRVAELGVAKLV